MTIDSFGMKIPDGLTDEPNPVDVGQLVVRLSIEGTAEAVASLDAFTDALERAGEAAKKLAAALASAGITVRTELAKPLAEFR